MQASLENECFALAQDRIYRGQEAISFGTMQNETGHQPKRCLGALCAAHDEAIRVRDDISFFQAVKS